MKTINDMNVGLFIPCYVDQFYPKIAIATLKLLEDCGLKVAYPMNQTCCGQPMANTGCTDDAKAAAEKFVASFEQYDYVVCPSGSCTSFVKNHYEFLEKTAALEKVRKNTYELCEFLVDIVKKDDFNATFPHKISLHNCCHGHRGLRLAQSSERVAPHYSKIEQLLLKVKGITLVEPEYTDECCGFGGTFSINEEAMSCKMGLDRIADHQQTGSEFITGVDMSCLMHMEGLIKRYNKPIQVKHVAEILVGGQI